MRLLCSLIFLLLAILAATCAVAQDCPPNIGFENGTLSGWQCDTGSVLGGTMRLTPSVAISGRHTILKNTSPQAKDLYGNFPVNCPNGSGYSVMLGNSAINGQAERMSYTINIPADQPNYTIIYYYAVVFENPNHPFNQQPKFTANVFDVTANKYADCGSFEFVASSGLEGFQKSDIGNDVFYKPWAPITVNLLGYAGKTIRLEFTTNDCTQGRHFGYAYIDVNENCKTPINGSNYCLGLSSLTLTAPAGFLAYRWFNADLSQVLGTNYTLTLPTPPPDGTVFALEITPYAGLGCKDTLYTTVHPIDQTFALKVQKSIQACDATGADITQPGITAGSSPGLKLEYFQDQYGENYLSDPKKVMASGYYYIRGTNSSGCTDLQPIEVQLTATPHLVIQSPPTVCMPAIIDITNKQWIGNYDPTLTYTYWSDAAATQPLAKPEAIDKSGTYYIMAKNNSLGCTDIQPIYVTIGTLPKIITHTVTICSPANLTASNVTAGSDAGLTYTYWLDAAATVPLTKPEAIYNSGVYYIKGTNATYCETIVPVTVSLLPDAQLTIGNQQPVVYPATVNLTNSFNPVAGMMYTYWQDAAATVPLQNYLSISESGTYYIKSTNSAGCYVVKPVTATIYPPIVPDVVTSNTFSPNGDGVNDLFKIELTGIASVNNFSLYNRWGQLLYEAKSGPIQWDGTYKGSVLDVGTYYWVLNYTDTYRKQKITKSGYIAIVK